jgi:hypothetical protein
MQHDNRLVVYAMWDDDAKVWVATSEDVPGLVTEDPSLDSLVRRIGAVIPELLDANAPQRAGGAVDFCVVSSIERREAPAH